MEMVIANFIGVDIGVYKGLVVCKASESLGFKNSI